MDNKKWYKRISTCFWFLLATMPFWLSVVMVIGSYFIHTDGVTASINDFETFINNSSTRWWTYFQNLNNVYFSDLVPSFILSVFDNLLINFGIVEAQTFSICLTWFVWTYFIELMVDFVVWLPRLIHSFMERWCRD